MTREILCGLTYSDVIDIAAKGMTLGESARKLGVSNRQFYLRLKELGMRHWFQHSKRPYKQRQRCITAEDIRQVAAEGYTRKDAAYLLGISEAYLKDLIQLWSLQDCWAVSKGRAAWVTRRGYA